jgi:hypothetical protein
VRPSRPIRGGSVMNAARRGPKGAAAGPLPARSRLPLPQWRSQPGTPVYLIIPAPASECFQICLETLVQEVAPAIVLFVPATSSQSPTISSASPPHSPEPNPQEIYGTECVRKFSRIHQIVYAKVEEAVQSPTQSCNREKHHVLALQRQANLRWNTYQAANLAQSTSPSPTACRIAFCSCLGQAAVEDAGAHHLHWIGFAS